MNRKIICYFPLTSYNYDGEHTRVREGGNEGEEVKEETRRKKEREGKEERGEGG